MSILNKVYVITMSDGSQWEIPVDIIACNRAEFYKKEFDNDIQKSLDDDTAVLFEEDEYEVEDWAKNNMNWSDVKDNAKCIKFPESDYHEDWLNEDAAVYTKTIRDI